MVMLLYHGCMNSGKTDAAINQINSYIGDRRKAILFQPKANTRDVLKSKPIWASRAGEGSKRYLEAHWYESGKSVLDLAKKYDVFGFEEHHWYPEDFQETIRSLDELGKIVVVVGLDYFHNGQPVPNFWDLSQRKGTIIIPGVSAFCTKDKEKGVYTFAERTQLLIDGEPAYFDTPKDLVENPNKTYEYFPVSIANWKVKPPKDKSLNHQYKRFYLDVKEKAKKS